MSLTGVIKMFDNHMKNMNLVLSCLMILSICASAVIAYTVTSETTSNNTEDIKDLRETIDDNRRQINENNVNIAVLNTISEDIKEIKQDLKELNR